MYWFYRELELNLRIKPKKRLVREKPDALAVPDNLKLSNHTHRRARYWVVEYPRLYSENRRQHPFC
ncbi:hypothetical protein DV708_22110 [Aeromonas veronii]|uniref:Uncharacterized protein n=1 Tax=Aeromonas veronii TaxID=654 RepID=A0A2T4N0N8_AERVE|nr:hypothetical protein DAA48_14480 [Aeromonas veronii]RDE59502.1 hypothetical protein DV708_22110 [Aeromonas veronii]